MSDSTTLAEETERLNRALDAAELTLQQLDLGVAAKVPLPSGGELHFHKRGAVWCLEYTSDGGALFTAASATSRRTRVEIGGALPALHGALLAEVARQRAVVADAASTAEAWAAAVSKEPG